jgi:hypothetical protein
VAAKFVLGGFAIVFLSAAMWRLSTGGGVRHPQTRTWLMVGVIFSAVSAWLFLQG